MKPHSPSSTVAVPAFALRIVCFGDSITGPHPETRYLENYLKWSDLLQLILETHLGPGKVEVLNRGWAGSTSAQAVARFAGEVLALKPDIVIVLIGGNDFGNSTDPRQAARDLKHNLMSIVDGLRKAEGKVLLLQYAEPKADQMEKVWRHLDAANPVIAEVARQERLPTLALAPAFAEAAKTHPQADLTNPVDGVHLNPYGEVVLARAVFLKLLDLNWVTVANGRTAQHISKVDTANSGTSPRGNSDTG